MLSTSRILTAAAAALVLTVLPALARAQNAPAAAGAQAEAAQLLKVLQSSSSSELEKAQACKRLAIVGTKEAVPVLAALLGDEKFSHYARFALEPIPDASVDDALRAALGKVQGRLRLGVIHSIAFRKDAQAVDALVKLLADPDAELAGDAAAALGRIGGPAALPALRQALTAAPAALRPAVADACLTLAEGLAAGGKADEAVALYDTLRQAELPKHLQAAATRGAIVARKAAGLPLLVEQLRSSDAALFSAALAAARELPSAEVTEALVETLVAPQLGRQREDRKAAVMRALSDRGDAAAVPVAVEFAKNGAPAVRLEAIRLLAKSGAAAALPILLEAAVQGDGDLAQAAQDGLVNLGGKEVDAALAALLAQGDGRGRRVVIELVGQRRVTAALPSLLKAADDADQEIRFVALRALGETGGMEHLPMLIARLTGAKTPEETEVAKDAVRAAAVRMTDQDASAAKLVEALPQASTPIKGLLFELLSRVGGPRALKAVAAAARDPDADLQDAASRVLGEWMSADAGPELLSLAQTSQNNKFKLRALRGYIRIARQLDMPAEQRLAMCREAMGVAQRDEDRKLVLGALSRVPTAEALAVAVPYLDSPKLKADAAAAAVAISDKLVQTQPAAVAEAMPKVLAAAQNPELASKAKLLLDQATAKSKK